MNFQEFCKTFRDKFQNGDITVILARKFLVTHKFDCKSSSMTKKDILSILHEYIDGKTTCGNEIFDEDDLKLYLNDKNKHHYTIKPCINQNLYDKVIECLTDDKLYDILQEYYNYPSSRRKKKITPFIESVLKLVTEECKNVISTKYSLNFFEFLIQNAKIGLVISNYTKSEVPCIITCSKLHHVQTCRSAHRVRLNNNKNGCCICGEDGRNTNPHLKNRTEIYTEKIKEYLTSIKSNFISYDPKSRITTFTCPYCEKHVWSKTSVIGWISCLQCSNIVSGNKLTQTKINCLLENRGIYKSTLYENKDHPITYSCPDCKQNTMMRVYEILHEDISCVTCKFKNINNIYNKKFLDRYNIDTIPTKHNDSQHKYLTSVQFNYNKKEKKILDIYGIDEIHDIRNKFSLFSVMRTNIIPNKKATMSVDTFELIKKNSKQTKYHKLKNNQIVSVQGYETIVIDVLRKIYSLNKISISANDMPPIFYKDIDGTDHRYFPDFYIKHKNLFIEVKSTFTLVKQFCKNMFKMIYTCSYGYNFELWICNEKTNIVYVISMSKSTIDGDNATFNYKTVIFHYKNYDYNKIKTIHKEYSINLNEKIKITNNFLTEQCVILNKIFCLNIYESKENKIVNNLQLKKKEKSDIISNTHLLTNSAKKLDLNHSFIHEYFWNGTWKIPSNVVEKIRKEITNDASYLEKISETCTNLTSDIFPSITCDKKLMMNDFYSISNNNSTLQENEILSNKCGIILLNAFTIDTMMNARRVNSITLYEMWSTYLGKKQLWNYVFSKHKNNSDITPFSMVQAFSYIKSRVYNFPPTIAKTVYNHFNSKRVLDFCAGYGGRLLGFWCAKNTVEYIGIDPNTNIRYSDIINWITSNDKKKKTIKIIQRAAEDVNYKELGMFDTIFTSPPYYNLEIYSDDESQSTSRYNSYVEWKNKFLNYTIRECESVLLKNGYLLINIKNIKRYKIADDMIEYIMSLNKFKQHTSINLKTQSRPFAKNIETLYVFQKL